MKPFLKENIAIVAAIALPVLLAVVFFISTSFNAVTVADPKHDFLVATDYYAGNSQFNFNVVNGALVVSYQPSEKDPNGYHRNTQVPKLWRVHVPDMTVEQIALVEPTDKKAADITLPDLQNLKMNSMQPGPDGYMFENYYRYNNSFMSEVFSPGNSHSRQYVALVKDGRAVRIRVPENNSWNYNSNFIGWIVESE